MLYIRLISTLFLFVNLNASMQTDWKLRKDDAGVKVFTRNIEGSPFEEFKAVVTIPHTTLTGVLDIITNVKDYPVNFPNCSSAKVLVQKAKYDDIHYLTINAPWPVTDRDAIYEATTTISADGKHARIKLVPRGDFKAENKDFIRVYNGSGFWELDEIAPNSIQVVYQFHADPAGSIPAWVANSVIVSNPFRTMESLRNLATRN